MLAIGLDVGVARITYGVALPAFARDLQLSLTAAGLLGTLHLIGYLLGTLASPSLDATVGALALCHVSDVYGRFTGGFKTADLVAAKALLDALR
jgi:hypothetical protein